MDEIQRSAAPLDSPQDSERRPAAVARLRGSFELGMADDRVEQRPQRGHDAVLPLPDRRADGGRSSGWAEAMGSQRAVPSRVDAPDEALGTGDRPLGGGNLAARAGGSAGSKHQPPLRGWEVSESAVCPANA